MPVTDGVPGAPGVPGLVPPPQAAPLSVQLDGVAPPGLPLKPKLAVAPGARVPFQPTLVKVKRCPLRLIDASQKEPMLAPAGRSKATDQPLIVVVPPLVIVYLPSKPAPQSETLVKTAVGDAAWAGSATVIARTRAARATRERAMARNFTLTSCVLWGGVTVRPAPRGEVRGRERGCVPYGEMGAVPPC